MRNSLLLSASALVLLLASPPEARAYLTPEEVLGVDGQTVTVSSAGARSSARGSVLHGAAASVSGQTRSQETVRTAATTQSASSARRAPRHRLPLNVSRSFPEIETEAVSSTETLGTLHGGAPLAPSGPVGPLLLIVALIVGIGTLVRAVWMERRAR